MTYSYECSNCGHEQEEWHGMSERPLVHCNKCRGSCIKLIGTGSFISGMNGGRSTYDFIDYNTTGKPVEIKSKRQWDNHLKAHGLNDDVPNTPPKMSDLKSGVAIDKKKQKLETHQAIVAAVKDKKFKSEIKKTIKKQLYEARNK